MPDDRRLLNAINDAEANAYGADRDGELQSERSLAINYYRGDNVEPAPEGRSQVVDRSVFEAIQWMMPSLVRIFSGGDNVVEFIPQGPEDEEASQQESDQLNYMVTQKNDWPHTIRSWFHDALLTKNAYCMAYMDEVVRTETETYEGKTPEEVTLLLQEEGVELVGQEMTLEGVDDFGNPVAIFTVEIKRSTPEHKLCFRVLPPEQCKISEQTYDYTLKTCDYFEYWDDRITISELRAMGFDVPDDIASDPDTDDEEQEARDVYFESDSESDPLDPAMRRVKVRTVWIRYDYDEDGISELQKVIIVGTQILHREEAQRIPVASIVPYPLSHRHIGLSVADIVMDAQRIKTAILRQGLDNLYLTNNQRMFATDRVNLDDLLINRPGGVVRGKDGAIFGQDLAPIQIPFVFPQAIEGMNYMDQVIESRTGLNKVFQGVDPDALNNTATGINQLSSMAAQRVEFIARIFAVGVRELFSISHELLLKAPRQVQLIKLRNQWVPVDPSNWRTGRDLKIAVSFGAGNKDAQLARIVTIIQSQMAAAQAGIVQPLNLYNSHVELAKLSDFSTPEKFFTDPRTVPPQEPPPDPVMVSAQVETQKTQQRDAEVKLKIQEEQRQHEVDTALEKYKADLNAEVRLLVEKMQQGGKVDLEAVKADLSNRNVDTNVFSSIVSSVNNSQEMQLKRLDQMMESMGKTLEKVAEEVSADKEVVRDSSGKIVGTRKINGRSRGSRSSNKGASASE